MFAQDQGEGLSHALDLDLGGLLITVEEVQESVQSNIDDCMSTFACVACGGTCWGSASSLTSIVSCGS